MKTKYLLFAFIAFTLYSCEKAEVENEQIGSSASLTVYSGAEDNSDTKTALVYEDGKYKTKWAGGEYLKVFLHSAPATAAKTSESISCKNFINTTDGISSSADFVPESDFWGSDFSSEEDYIVVYNGDYLATRYSEAGSTTTNFVYYSVDIPRTQTYTPGEPFKIAQGILPLYGGVYCLGNTDKYHVEMKNTAIIINLTLQNQMKNALEVGVPVTIKKIVLESTVGTSRDGIAGSLIISVPGHGNSSSVQSGYGCMNGTGYNSITLNCPSGKRPTINYGDSESFGFVIGNKKPLVLTWTAYGEDDLPIGNPVSIDLTAKTLSTGKYYSITRALTKTP